MKWSDIIRADIIMSATGPSAQIMSDQITSDKVCNYKFDQWLRLFGDAGSGGPTVGWVSI